MEKFESGAFSATIHCAISYCVVGENKKTTIDYGTSNMEMEREKICLDSSHYLTRLKITNISGTYVKLLSAYPIITDDFVLGDKPSYQWEVFNGTRQLNDVPATCVLGVKDASFAEAVNRLSEEGFRQYDYTQSDSVLSGDCITVVKSGKQYASLEVITCENALNDISISSDYRGNVKAVRVGGEFNCLMEPGDELYTDWVRISVGGNFIRLIDDFANTRKAMSPCPNLSEKKPSIYIINDLSQGNISEKLSFLKGLKAPFDYIMIGSGWENQVGDWEQKDGFNLANIAARINTGGFKAGLWTAPFLMSKDSEIYQNNKKWALRHADGSVCTYIVNDKEYLIMDISSQECVEYLSMTYQRLSAYGFYLHNVDFLSAFVMQKDVVLLDPTLTLVKAYVNAMKAIKNAIGENGYLYATNAYFPALSGIAQTVQVVSGIDTLASRSKTNVYSRMINQAALRGYMSKWWHNTCSNVINDDFARKFSSSELKQLMVCEYITGASPVVSDINSNENLVLLKCLLPHVNLNTYPREAFDENAFIRVVDVEVNNDYHTVCFFNNSFAPVDLIFRLDGKTCGGYVDRSSKYNVSSYFGREKILNCEFDKIVKLGTIPGNSCEIVKIAKSGKPQIVLSDSHFSMGGEVEIEWNESCVCIRGNNRFNSRASYTVALPEGTTTMDSKTEFTFTVNGSGPFKYEKTIK